MPSFEISSFKGGYADQESSGGRGSFKFGENLDIRKDRDTLTINNGLVSESLPGSFISGTTFVQCYVQISGSELYLFCSDGKIFKRTGIDTYTLVYTDADGSIQGAAQWYDWEGNMYLYWATPTKLKIKRLSGPSYTPPATWTDVNANTNIQGGGTQSWPKTDLTSSPNNSHAMCIVGGALFICNSDNLAEVGYDNSYTNKALDFIPGFFANTIIEYQRYAYVGCTRSDSLVQSALFAWNTTNGSTHWNFKKIIPEASINNILDSEYTLMQCGNGKIYNADFNNVLPLKNLNNSPSGSVPYGSFNDKGVFHYGMNAGSVAAGVYTYGRKSKLNPFSLSLDHAFEDTTQYITCLVNGGDNGRLVCWKKTVGMTTTSGIKRISTTTYATFAIYQSLDLKLPFKENSYELGTIEQIILTTAPLPAGTYIEVYRKTDKTGSWNICNLVDGTTQFTTDNAQEAVFLVGDKCKVCEIQIILYSDSSKIYTPEIYKVNVLFN